MIADLLPPTVSIDQGTFKYILIKTNHNGETRYFVRGDKNLEYHADNFAKFAKQIKARGFANVKNEGEVIKAERDGLKFQFNVLGGGRLKHGNKKCHIYGYSQSYGQCDHNITKQLILKELGYDDPSVTWSNDGY